MYKTFVHSKLGINVSLAILPGLWIATWQSSGVGGQVHEQIVSIVAMALAFGVIGCAWIVKRRLTIWSLPSWGVLCWVGWKWILGIINARSIMAPLIFGLFEKISLLYALLGIEPGLFLWCIFWLLIACSVYLVYRKSGLRISRRDWKLWLLAMLVTMAYVCSQVLPHSWLALGSVLSLTLMFMSVAIGFSLSKCLDVGAALLVVSCVPTAFEMMFYGNFLYVIHKYAYELPNAKFALPLLVLSALPVFCCLVITPAGVLCSHSSRSQQRWLLVPSLLTLVIMNVGRGLMLQNTPAEYSWSTWLEFSLAMLQLWVPLLLVATLYVRQPNQIQGTTTSE